MTQPNWLIPTIRNGWMGKFFLDKKSGSYSVQETNREMAFDRSVGYM